jgi:hypothetical protein
MLIFILRSSVRAFCEDLFEDRFNYAYSVGALNFVLPIQRFTQFHSANWASVLTFTRFKSALSAHLLVSSICCLALVVLQCTVESPAGQALFVLLLGNTIISLAGLHYLLSCRSALYALLQVCTICSLTSQHYLLLCSWTISAHLLVINI